MPWNEPGSGKSPNSGGQRPGGRKSGASEFEDMIDNLRKGFGKKSGSGNGGSGAGPSLLPLILIAGLAFMAFKCFYTVNEGEQSVELRLGKHKETVGPGLNFMLWPIDRRIQVDTQKIRTVEVGYRGSSPKPDEALMLTNDENIVDVTMAVQYTIKDVEQLIFNVGDIERAGGLDLVVRGATESALREVVGRTKMDGLLTQGRSIVDADTESLLQEILDRYLTGIDVNSIEIQDAVPPRQVSAAFDDVVKADQDKVTLVNQAEAYANDIIPKARGRAARTLQQAEAYKESTIAKATGEAERFNQILTEYAKAPEITRKRLYLETMEEVLGKTNKVMIDQQSGGNSLMYLPLDKLVGEQRNNSNASSSSVSNAAVSQPAQRRVNPVRNQRSSNREGR